MGKNDRKTEAKKRSQGWTIRQKNIKTEWHNVRMENCSLEKKRKNYMERRNSRWLKL